MAGAREFINSFTTDLENIEDKWDNYVVEPFGDAYEDAFKAFHDTAKEQREAEAAESWVKALAMLAFSMCGGGIMTAAFGTTAIKSIAGGAAQKLVNNGGLDFMVLHNMERAFRAANFLATNKTGNYIAGKLWDNVESGVSSYVGDGFKKAKAAVAQNAASFPSVDKFVREPRKIKSALSTFVGEAKIKCHDLAAGIREDAKASDDQKIKDVSELRKSPLFKAPQSSIAHAKLADEIELSFYLYMVTESDVLLTDYREDWEDRGRNFKRTGRYSPRKSTSIDEPATSTNYPNRIKVPGYVPVQELGFRHIGNVFIKKLNKLYKDKFNIDFVWDHGNVRATVQRAEQAISLLANGNVKRLIGGAL